MDNYASDMITKDAVDFAQSRFGKHYLERLHKAKQRALDDAMDLEMSDSYRVHRASQAKAIQSEIDYFATAQRVYDDPALMKKLRDKVLKRREPDIEL